MEQRCPKRKLGRDGRQHRAHQRLRAQDNESSEYQQKLWSHTKRKLDVEENCLADDKRELKELKSQMGEMDPMIKLLL